MGSIIFVCKKKQETRPGLGPKGLIVQANVNPVCVMTLFFQARLLLAITVHDILNF